jgi:transposase InsO family protein
MIRAGVTRALINLDIQVARGTILRILKDHLIEPAPSRGRRIAWSTFLKAHWRGLAASDFFTVEVRGLSGLRTFYVLFVIDLATRRVTLCGMTMNPNEAWMLQMSRNMLDGESGSLRDKRYLIVDRDMKYSASFRQTLEREGIGVIRLPPRSPNLNAYAERFVRSVKEECLSKIIPIGASMLRRSPREYAEHYPENEITKGSATARSRRCGLTVDRRAGFTARLASAASSISITAARRDAWGFRTIRGVMRG